VNFEQPDFCEKLGLGDRELVSFISQHVGEQMGSHSELAEEGKAGQAGEEHRQGEIWNPFCGVLGCSKCKRVEAGESGYDTHGNKESNKAQNARFRLASVLCSVQPPEIGDVMVENRFVPCEEDQSTTETTISDLPETALMIILSFLDSADLRRLSMTCHYLRELVTNFIPGLKLCLYPHQRVSLHWMLNRERPRDVEEVCRPGVVHWMTTEGFCIQADLISHYIRVVETETNEFKDFRGGLFCDEPGLGKTITALALILKTKGLVPIMPHETLEPVQEFSTEILRELRMKRLGINASPSTAVDLAENSIQLVDIEDRFKHGSYTSVHKLLQDVKMMVNNKYVKSESDGCIVLDWERSLPRWLVEELVAPSPQPVPMYISVAAKTNRSPYKGAAMRELEPQSADVSTLNAHRPRHIKRKCNQVNRLENEMVSYCSRPAKMKAVGRRSPVESIASTGFTSGDACICLSPATLIICPRTLLSHWEYQLATHVEEHALRCLFIKSGKEWIPDPVKLSRDYDVVCISMDRVAAEMPDDMKRQNTESSLFRVHWLRVILDEGHEIGSLGLSQRRIAVEALRASRRWIMTGTPTPNTRSSDLPHLWPLLSFLRDPCYGESKQLWIKAIQTPFEQHREEGRERLLKLLERIMIRNTKDSVGSIPPLEIKQTILPFFRKQAEGYNDLVAMVRRNLLLADFFDFSHEQSLLNPRNKANAAEILQNLRKSCNVAGHIGFQVNQLHLADMIMELRQKRGLEAQELKRLAEALRDGSDCDLCDEWTILPVVTPCGHLLCSDCTAKSRNACPKCSNAYVPGLKGEPKDLIELQPTFSQESWKGSWYNTVSAKLAVLCDRLQEIATVEEYDREKKVIVKRRRKIIIFTQFLEHSALIARKLNERSINRVLHVSSMTLADRLCSLFEFQRNPDMGILIADKSAAVGHDLSFVSHIFLMEPVWDRSLEFQMISRAHRIGAREKIVVEKFAIQGTLEEELLDQSTDEREGGSQREKENTENLRMVFILGDLKMVPTKGLEEAPVESNERTEGCRWGWFSNS